MKTIAKHLTRITAACIILLASANLAHAAVRCTNETFRGRYGAELTGVAGVSFKTVFVFNFVADGRGGIPSGEGTQGFPGLIINNITLVGTYHVNPDCSGQLTVTSNDGDVGIENFILMDGGNQLMLIDDIRGDVLTGTAERISRDPDTHCSNDLIKGTYALKETGFEDGNNLFGFVGKFTADGKGSGTNGSGTIAVGPGLIVNNLTFTVNYSVNANCSGTLALANLPPTFEAKTFNIVILEGGRKMLLIDTDTDNEIETAIAQRTTRGDDSDDDR